MSLNQLHQKLKKENIKVLFTDYYDTLVHRSVHPNYTQRIWAKFMIRELGLPISIDALYFIRKESSKYLLTKTGKLDIETPYEALKQEICKRLINSNIIENDNVSRFLNLFEEADVRAEISVQYLNQDVLDIIKYFKSNGGKVYLVSDFYGPKSLFEKLVKYHGIEDIFDGIYSSASLEKSKHTGTIYNQLLSELQIEASEVMMIGDNLKHDFTHALKYGLNAYQLPHKKYLRKNKSNNFGNDEKKLNKVIHNLYKKTKKRTTTPYTEYIVFYHVFVERMYKLCKQKGITNLFFLSREGQYLKKLFDSYQEFTLIDKKQKINSHYLKISRQASLQFSLKDIDEEEFGYLSKKHSDLSVNELLITFNCPEELRRQIVSEINIDGDLVITNFFNSEILQKLKENTTFKAYYDSHSAYNFKAFKAYLNSFNVDLRTEGMAVVDIGWGGTMQESLFTFFNEEIPVTGYYLGLDEIYNIQPKTKRYGLNFTVMPYVDYNDHILKANKQLYEQFSAANHGSVLGYTLGEENFTLEYHKPEEKWLYDNHIEAHQKDMFDLHLNLLKDLNTICYDQAQMQNVMSQLALKVGLFQNNRKLKFLDTLSKGFYQNVGDNRVGISYERPKIKNPVKSIISFLLTPEKYFKALVKLKPMLYKKNKVLAFLTPMYFIYLYFKINKYIRFRVLNRFVLLKYNVFK
ncbi:MAG: HAD family hydrolase [Winogradskyella sp.]|uniref:HAD family hydrolase n=1 Tax=Winogradskyella sp. TaxID=1883156 RepID=UPI00181A90FF|nr:HAD family hydrolase [Winogradskyella sp.]